MEDPFSPLYDFLLEAPKPEIPEGIIRYNRSVYFDLDGKMRTIVDKEQGYTWSPQWWEDVARIYHECEQKERWTTEAKRQLYVAQVKAQIKRSCPVTESFQTRMIALTISPCPEQATVHHVQEIARMIAKKFVKPVGKPIPKPYVSYGCYTFEQRSQEGEEEYGWHIHFSFDTTYPQSKISQYAEDRLKRKFRCTYKATPDDGGFRSMYMKGYKFDEEKDLKVRQDLKLREKYGLQDFYEFRPE